MSLPVEFKDLQPYAQKWALATEVKRNATRLSASMEEISEFYALMGQRLDHVLETLGEYSPESLPENLKPLFYLTLSYCEVAPAVELFKQPSVVDGFDPNRFPRIDIPNMTPAEV